LQELIVIPHNSWQFGVASLCLRTGLLAVCVLVAIVVPFFAFVMSFIGAFMSMSISIVLPCLFYCKICQQKLKWPQYAAAGAVAAFGVVAGTVATYQAVTSIWGKY
jgi:vesicular inhibitory amino acid transporter